ncbi:MAG TPA: hypothetical protein VIJ12_05735 [Candidatus Baltobacteraceae bacterium]
MKQPVLRDLIASGFLAALCALVACPAAVAAAPADVAVYAEYSPASKVIAANWNTRIFDKREFQEGSRISLEDGTGVITLQPGLYHVTASSLVTYFDPSSPTTTPVNANPPGGYARLRNADDPAQTTKNEKALAIGTVSNADTIPSLIDTYLRITKTTRMVLEHQIGTEITGVYLHVYTANSAWHVFARIAIQRVGP